MNVSRGFLLVGSLYLLVGILFGMYMGGSGDHSMAPLHAHINLLGFVLMMLFGLIYRQFPGMAKPLLARLHFWLHQAGTLTLLIMLFLLFSGRIQDAAMAPIAPIAETAVLAGVAIFAFNLYKNGK
jgi:cbb3-type cytochrome oxidase subunit 1